MHHLFRLSSRLPRFYRPVVSIALPRLACGLTGLDWNEVKPLIENQLGDLGIPVYIYATYQKGIKAVEPTGKK